MVSKRAGIVKFSDNYDYAETIDETGTKVTRCMVRHAKLFILDKDGSENATFNIFLTDQLYLLTKVKASQQKQL